MNLHNLAKGITDNDKAAPAEINAEVINSYFNRMEERSDILRQIYLIITRQMPQMTLGLKCKELDFYYYWFEIPPFMVTQI